MERAPNSTPRPLKTTERSLVSLHISIRLSPIASAASRPATPATVPSHTLGRRLKERGQIYLGSYSGWYAVRDEAFYQEDELETQPDGKKVSKIDAKRKDTDK